MRETEAHVRDGERPERDAEPEDTVREDRALQRDEPPALFVRRPGAKVGENDVHPDRIEDPRQVLPSLREQEESEDQGHREDQHTAEIAGQGPAASAARWRTGSPSRGRESASRGTQAVMNAARRKDRSIQPRRRGIDAHRAARLPGEHDRRVEDESGEESPAEVLGLLIGRV